MNGAEKSYQDPRVMIPPGYAMQPGQTAIYGSQPQYAFATSHSASAGSVSPSSQVPPGYPHPGYAPPPGQAVPGYPPPVYAPPGYAPPGYGAQGHMPYPGTGYPPNSVAPEPGMPYGMPYAYAVPVGHVPPEFAAHVAFGAFAAGMPPSAFAGIARMMGVPQPPQDNDPRNRITTGQWDAGLFSCCTHCVPNGLMSLICPCVTLAQIVTRLGSPRYTAVLIQFACLWLLPIVVRVMTEIMFHSMFGPAGGLPSVVNLPLVVPMFMMGMIVMSLRQRIRMRYKIPASPCEDCVAACCCTPCALAQIATHVKSYTPGNCSFDPPDMLPPFQ